MIRKLAIFAAVVLVGAAIMAYVLRKPSEQRAPIQIIANPQWVQMNLDELIAKADKIVVGQAISKGSSQWNTPDGQLPPGTTVQTISTQLTIFTETEFRVDEALKGAIQPAELRIRTFGGQVGQDSVLVQGEPVLELNQGYLLFLIRDAGRTANFHPDHYLILGSRNVYKLSNDNAISAADQWALADLIHYIQHSLSTQIAP